MLLRERKQLADKLQGLRQRVASAVTDEFFLRHPDWLERYGDRGKQLGIEDAGYHMDFLIAAVAGEAMAGFVDYTTWTCRTLNARGIAPSFVAENLQQIKSTVCPYLTAQERVEIARLIDAGIKGCHGAHDHGTIPSDESPLALTQRVFLQALLDGKRQASASIALEALRAGNSAIEIYIEIFQASLYEIGRLWETNRITVAQEHMATAITQYVISQIYTLIPQTTDCLGKVIITGVQGELHQIGAHLVADVLEAEGYDVRFLGTNMPHSGILDAIEEHQADMVGISTTLLCNIPQAIRLIDATRERFPTHCPRIILGGAAYRFVPSIGADLGCDAILTDLRAVKAALGRVST